MSLNLFCRSRPLARTIIIFPTIKPLDVISTPLFLHLVLLFYYVLHHGHGSGETASRHRGITRKKEF